MKHNRIKKVISANGRVSYYLGDGMWFGRISAAEAELGLAAEKFVLWQVVTK